MDRNRIAQLVAENPEILDQARERMQGVLTRSATDVEFRTALMADPRAALSKHFDQEIPESYNVVFIENTADATVVLPDFIDPSAELSEAELEAVAGGSEPLSLIAAGVIIGATVTALAFKIAS